MTGKLKTRGNMMLATKLDTVLKVRSCLSICFTFFLTQPCRFRARKPNSKPIIINV